MSSGYIISIPLRLFLGGALVSARLCRLPEQEVHQPYKRFFQGVHLSQVHQPSKNVNYRKEIGALDSFVGYLIALLVHLRQVHPLEGTRHPIRFRPPPDQIAFAVRSDCVRRPIRFRPLSDDILITIKGQGLHIRVLKPQISVGKISENSNIVLTLVRVRIVNLFYVCAN